MAPKRAHSPTGNSRSNAKLKGSLSWNKSASQPAFLKNAYAALSGNSSAQAPGSRPGVPSRPEGAEDESEEDEWDFGRGEEAPAVVVLKEGKHIDRGEVDRLRAEAKATSSADPTSAAAQPSAQKSTGSLNFSSSATKKAPKASEPGAAESWEDIVSRAKADAAAKALSAEQEAEEVKRKAERDEKRKKKEKKDNKKKIAMLSFEDE